MGKVGKFALQASLVCRWSFQHLLCRLFGLQSNFQYYPCIGYLSRVIAKIFCIHIFRSCEEHFTHWIRKALPAETAATAEHLPVARRSGRDLRYRQGFAVELGRCREPSESQ